MSMTTNDRFLQHPYDFDMAAIRACLKCTEKQVVSLYTTFPQSTTMIRQWCQSGFITPEILEHIKYLSKISDEEWRQINTRANLNEGTLMEHIEVR